MRYMISHLLVVMGLKMDRNHHLLCALKVKQSSTLEVNMCTLTKTITCTRKFTFNFKYSIINGLKCGEPWFIFIFFFFNLIKGKQKKDPRWPTMTLKVDQSHWWTFKSKIMLRCINLSGGKIYFDRLINYHHINEIHNPRQPPVTLKNRPASVEKCYPRFCWGASIYLFWKIYLY